MSARCAGSHLAKGFSQSELFIQLQMVASYGGGHSLGDIWIFFEMALRCTVERGPGYRILLHRPRPIGDITSLVKILVWFTSNSFYSNYHYRHYYPIYDYYNWYIIIECLIFRYIITGHIIIVCYYLQRYHHFDNCFCNVNKAREAGGEKTKAKHRL